MMPFIRAALRRIALSHAAHAAPAAVAFLPPSPSEGAFSAAETMMAGRFTLAGETKDIAQGALWETAPPSDEWARRLHAFGWLAHFSTAEGDAARRHARDAIMGWIAKHGQGEGAIAWEAGVTGARLMNWLRNLRLAALQEQTPGDTGSGGRESGRAGSIALPAPMVRSLDMQARWLAKNAHRATPGLPRFTACAGQVMAALCLRWPGRRIARGVEALETLLAQEILPDGGHVSRNPHALSGIFAILSILSRVMNTHGRLPDRGEIDALKDALARMAPMLRRMQMGDGRLGMFHGGRAGMEGEVDRILADSGERGQPQGEASHSRYHRMRGGRTLVLTDVGAPPPAPFDAHDGALAFEMSVGRQRMIVNCGEGGHLGAAWRAASRRPAAHSTLCFAIDPLPPPRPRDAGVRVRQHRDAQGFWLKASTDRYRRALGLTHGRRLHLAIDGSDFRGEDSLFTQGRGEERRLASVLRRRGGVLACLLRFHLHPDIAVIDETNDRQPHILLPNGDRWIFSQNGGALSIEESVWLGSRAPALRHTVQIVVRAAIGADAPYAIAWAFSRLGGGDCAPRDYEASRRKEGNLA